MLSPNPGDPKPGGRILTFWWCAVSRVLFSCWAVLVNPSPNYFKTILNKIISFSLATTVSCSLATQTCMCSSMLELHSGAFRWRRERAPPPLVVLGVVVLRCCQAYCLQYEVQGHSQQTSQIVPWEPRLGEVWVS